MIRFFYLSIIFSLTSCNNIEVDTVDPQSSKNVAESKENGFYINEYNCDTLRNNFLNAKETWLEYCWKYEIESGKVIRIKTEGKQLNMKISILNSDSLVNNKYLINWRLEADNIGVFGRGNGVYTLYVENTELPDNLQINLEKRINNFFINIDSFKIIKK